MLLYHILCILYNMIYLYKSQFFSQRDIVSTSYQLYQSPYQLQRREGPGHCILCPVLVLNAVLYNMLNTICDVSCVILYYTLYVMYFMIYYLLYYILNHFYQDSAGSKARAILYAILYIHVIPKKHSTLPHGIYSRKGKVADIGPDA